MSKVDRLAEKMSRLCLRVVDEAESVDFMFGTVKSSKPLGIEIEQRLLLPEGVLVLSAAVVDLVPKVDEASGEVTYEAEHNLTVGEHVILAKVRGGEAYVVINRCYGMEATE